ncbi:endo-beta-N-acetylglucosaminidase H [Mucilaginibacter defluvii]|uniref:GH18 domain-containing protein n=1 Tax=Mucilaginibacter defluvii TaxID=1196019 RepID=A0ABP9FTC7_9SPHI
MKTNLVFKNAAVMTAGALMLLISACKKDAAPVVDANKQIPVKRADALGASGPKSVCYVEVNYNDIRNVGNYKLTTGEQLFDIGIIFAANINYNTSTQTAQLYFNPQVTNVLTNRNTYVQPLQDRGIKVLLSILGNHQGAGICNFPNQAAAQAFAQQLANAVNTYNLDGIDFDDEYSDYGVNGTGQPNSSSFVYLVTALRQLLPNKIISFYFYGPAASRLSYNGVTVGSKINYSWNAIYGTYSVPSVPGLSAANLGPAAIDIQATSSATAANLATQTVNNGYGIYLTYNLPNTDVHTYLSSFSNQLYGKATVYDTSLGTGVRFFADANYGGYGTGIIPKGTYTLTQLEKFGFVNDWASSIKIPSGWTVTMYADNNSTGQSWTLTSNNSNFTTLTPNANDVITSVKIQ